MRGQTLLPGFKNLAPTPSLNVLQIGIQNSSANPVADVDKTPMESPDGIKSHLQEGACPSRIEGLITNMPKSLDFINENLNDSGHKKALQPGFKNEKPASSFQNLFDSALGIFFTTP